MEIILITRPARDKSAHQRAITKLREKKFQIEINKDLYTKMILVDDKKLYVGSANMLKKSISVNQEAGIITEDEYLVQPAIRYFNKIYDEAVDQRTIKQ